MPCMVLWQLQLCLQGNKFMQRAIIEELLYTCEGQPAAYIAALPALRAMLGSDVLRASHKLTVPWYVCRYSEL